MNIYLLLMSLHRSNSGVIEFCKSLVGYRPLPRPVQHIPHATSNYWRRWLKSLIKSPKNGIMIISRDPRVMTLIVHLLQDVILREVMNIRHDDIHSDQDFIFSNETGCSWRETYILAIRQPSKFQHQGARTSDVSHNWR